MRPWMLGVALLAVAGGVSALMEARAPWRSPSLSELEPTPFAFRDAVLAAGGLRAAAADLAWIQLLQYTAGNLPEFADRPGRRYDRILSMSRRAWRLDPSFTRAALYGAGVLVWEEGVSRPEEAAELLEECIRRRPAEPLYKLYLAALAYKRKGDDARMLELLERSFDDPTTPSTMKAILANLYTARKDYPRAYDTWQRILANPADASEHSRARERSAMLREKLRAARAPKARGS